MKKTFALIFVLCLPTLVSASMNVIHNQSGNIIAINPWSYLNEEVMWTSVHSINSNGGMTNGYIKSKYTAEFAYFKNHHHVSDNMTFAQGVLRSQNLPGWYLGFSSNRQANYSSSYGHHEFVNNTFDTEVVIGKESRYDNLRLGADITAGYRSSGLEDDQGKFGYWKTRVKFYTDIQLNDHLSIFGYAYQQFDRKRIRDSENDRDMRSTAFEPGIQYIINNNNGIWVRAYYDFVRLERQQWGNIKDRDHVSSIGYWNIWGKLQTSLSFGRGKYHKYNAKDGEQFYDRKYNYVQLNATYPISNRFTVYWQVKRKHLNETGNWSLNSKGNIYNYTTMIDFNF